MEEGNHLKKKGLSEGRRRPAVLKGETGTTSNQKGPKRERKREKKNSKKLNS